MSIIYIAPYRIFQDTTPRARGISTQRPNRGIFQSQTESIRLQIRLCRFCLGHQLEYLTCKNRHEESI